MPLLKRRRIAAKSPEHSEDLQRIAGTEPHQWKSDPVAHLKSVEGTKKHRFSPVQSIEWITP